MAAGLNAEAYLGAKMAGKNTVENDTAGMATCNTKLRTNAKEYAILAADKKF